MAELIEVTDPTDPRLADYRDLRDVQLRSTLEVEHGLFLAEGAKVVRRAVEAGFEARSFLMAPKWLDGLADVLERSEAPCYVMSERAAEQVTGFHVHRGALASLARNPLPSAVEVLDHVRTSSPHRRRRVAVLENLVDHANVGSVFRNAAAIGIDAVLITPQCADPFYRRAIKTSMGNVFQVPWTRTTGMPDTLAALREAGYTTVALTLSEDAIELDDLVAMELDAMAFVFGTEGAGVDPRTARQVDLRVKIPMEPGVDSLNVAAATAVTFYATR
ncbi:RNA methyltransferase [Nocardioides sp.]|uniref:TrmH family RNA methyltransferase n=1 Tax=Nocardioides sp. TaxID=35761 RepID=UPI002622149E|nr:RNA methyltransferase [Nocardioides sp.]